MIVETLKQTSVVNGKESYWIRIKSGKKEAVISVGEKTFNNVNECIDSKGEIKLTEETTMILKDNDPKPKANDKR